MASSQDDSLSTTIFQIKKSQAELIFRIESHIFLNKDHIEQISQILQTSRSVFALKHRCTSKSAFFFLHSFGYQEVIVELLKS